MPALIADISAASRASVTARWHDDAIKARYPSARDGALAPQEGLFDDIADAQTAADQQGALLGVERRRFTVTVAELLWLDPSMAIPTVRLVDSALGIDRLCMVSRFELDLDSETTSLELFG